MGRSGIELFNKNDYGEALEVVEYGFTEEKWGKEVGNY
jgi:hypothetical protein